MYFYFVSLSFVKYLLITSLKAMLEEKNDNLHPADGPIENENLHQEKDAIQSITNSNAEESEEIGIEETVEIPVQDYESMPLEELVKNATQLVNNHKAITIREHIEQIKKTFYHKYHDFIEAKKELFLVENPDASESDFQYELPVKNQFDSIYAVFKDNRSKHYKNIQDNLKKNLAERQAIIEELKNIVDHTDNYNTALKDIQVLRDRWKQAGPIPRDNYNHVWNNFHFHIERFYDQLHLDREARDIDFKFNLEQKQRLIDRAKELLEEADIQKAFRELQTLHRVWKEEIGPVAREYREDIWNEFSDITKKLHDKREGLQQQLRVKEEENALHKNGIIASINKINQSTVTSHSQWQQSIKEVDALRDQFFKIGRVPAELNEKVWEQFKEATRVFNTAKNNFYKDIKKDQQENLTQKLALIEKAKSLNESDDFDKVTPVMKQIQEDWKKIGHVPRKQSDEIWKEFKAACNHYFDRLHAIRNQAMSAEMENFDKKKAYLEELKSFELVGDHKIDLEAIKQHIENWKQLGAVPQSRRHIEGKFNKVLDALFDKLSLSKKEAELVKFNNRLEQLAETDDIRRIQHEFVFIQRKIDEVQSDIFQLENNVQFISGAKADNPLVKEINKNIERHKEELHLWKEKLESLRRISENK